VRISSAIVEDGISPPTSGCPLTRLFQRAKPNRLPLAMAPSGAAAVGNIAPPARSRFPLSTFTRSTAQLASVPNSWTQVPKRP